MTWLKFARWALLFVAARTYASPLLPKRAEPDPSLAVSVDLAGENYINKGLVGFGLIPSDFRESTGDTFGGIGSAIALKPGTFKSSGDGKFKGTLFVQPDRGFNVDHTIDYQARHHEVDFEFIPYYGVDPLSFADAQKTLKLEYRKTILHWDRKRVKTSGLDPRAVRPAEKGFPEDPHADPEIPIANASYNHLSVDAEGLVANDDETFWVSDEYGPYIYRFSHDGDLIQAVQPPAAIVPHDAPGNVNFTADSNAKTGRNSNQGMEGLTLDPETKTLYGMLQSPTFQDGATASRYTRLLAYDVSSPDNGTPKLIGEWVVPLPVDGKGKPFASSEIHFLKKNILLSLSRDGNGRGADNSTGVYKQADLFDISNATDIHGSKFDDPANPVSFNGTLDSTITPATYVSFVNYLDAKQLGRFGLHNGGINDSTLICGKWESLALASCGDDKSPDDFFLFTAADNDFITTNGISIGQPYNASLDNDNQFLVFRVTLPGVAKS